MSIRVLDRQKINEGQVLALGFLLVILLGAALLRLPIASRDRIPIPWIDAIFTASSATCVTGLIVYDTYTQFTLFGQTVILLLIQVGGLGFMTVATMFSMFIGRRIGLMERGLMKESVSTFQVGGIVRLLKHVLIGTAILEGAGLYCSLYASSLNWAGQRAFITASFIPYPLFATQVLTSWAASAPIPPWYLIRATYW